MAPLVLPILGKVPADWRLESAGDVKVKDNAARYRRKF
jgi:hypothetical protein